MTRSRRDFIRHGALWLAGAAILTPALADVLAWEKRRIFALGGLPVGRIFPGGGVYLVGANSPRGFRRRTARIIILEEVPLSHWYERGKR
jgi:hypothetical protein